jgi:defect-in-organelle-trafficking protein DotD
MNHRDIVSMKKIGLLTALTLAIGGCASPKPPAQPNVALADASLAEASYAVSRSIVDLAETAQAAHPAPNLAPPPAPASYGMGGVTTVDWSGPVEPLVKQLARAANYRAVVIGTPPAIPVLVTVNARNVMLGDIVRDVGFQCGERATVVVYPGSNVLELRYAKN